LQEASAGLRDCRRLERAGWVRDGSLPSPDPVDLPGINEARSLVVEQSERALSQGALLYSSPMVESGSSSHTGAGCFSAQLTPRHKTTGRFFRVTASAQVRGRFKRHSCKATNGAGNAEGTRKNNPSCFTEGLAGQRASSRSSYRRQRPGPKR